MHQIDWIIFIASAALSLGSAIYTRRFVRSVADFLASGRAAGRYLVANAEGSAAMGAITVIAIFEMIYKAGFTVGWWQAIQTPVWVLVAMTGYIIYRYRETRALTMAEFFERRYSRRFRIFMGVMAFTAGVINYGIFPAVGARFFVSYLSMPQVLHLGSVEIPTFAVVMAVLTVTNLFVVLMGGQLTAMVTDTVEGIVGGIFFVLIAIAVLYVVDWDQIASVMTASSGAGRSMLHPFDAGRVEDFNIWYVLIATAMGLYSYMAWQGNSGFNAAAASPHEAKMGRVLGHWRGYARAVMLTLVAGGAVAYMGHSDFAEGAAKVRADLLLIDQPQIQTQMTVPVAASHFLPAAAKGMFAAVMLFAVLACDASYTHSWGSIFVQDVLLPFRQSRGKPPLSQAEHIRWLRWAIVGVAVFAYFFSLMYRQTDYIYMFMALTGAIFLAGAGSCIIGGLYWRRGTAAGAWTSMIVGSVLAAAGILLQQLYPHFPLNGQILGLIATLAAIFAYVSVSLVTSRVPYNLERLLHRGPWNVDPISGEPLPEVPAPPRTWKSLIGIDENFTRGDKVIAVGLFVWSMSWFGVFLVITLWNLIKPWPLAWWSAYWFWAGIGLPLIIAALTSVWFTWGGVRDLRRLLAHLRIARRDADDDGVVDHRTDEVASAEGRIDR